MGSNTILQIVDAIHRDRNIDKELVFQCIEAALVSATEKRFGEEAEIVIRIDRVSGAVSGSHNGVPMTAEQMADRVDAQTAKDAMVQKIREAEHSRGRHGLT